MLRPRDNPVKAVESLALALHHPKRAAGWVQQWKLLTHLRTELENTLPSDQFAAAWARGQAADLQSVVKRLLNE